VKGEVLGAFLVEEPEPVAYDRLNTENTNRRLRPKRLEMITGISQQAALAIQNDVLQHEMVEQERLGREMQLAREIQRAFLPNVVPDLPGWDLKVRWRTAREVGGDFYDFFELPDGRFGLVIADVADKGMPAALFMTLSRTLVRAAVHETDSPAEVLMRVNDILVPDAPSGMYVTLAYAVISLDSGEIVYANAGQNPPIILRSKTCQLEKLTRTGMALGVVEGNQIENRQVSMQPGDYLVLYTDGVTEAFSPAEDMYGEDRLCEMVEMTAICAASAPYPAPGLAQDMLDAIDGSVVAFIGDATPSDDLTLIVLRYNPFAQETLQNP
jgi:sigma-B regulation protein RsbU (phosphoserine phosphatase)